LGRPAGESRGHGLARLDGTRPRATVAEIGDEGRKTDEAGNGLIAVQTARKQRAQARS